MKLLWLLANADMSSAGRSAKRYSSQSSSLSNNWFLIAAILTIGALWFGLYYWDRYRKNLASKGDSPKSLFLELCRAHKLSRSERTVLLQIAEKSKLQNPAMIFVDPSVLRILSRSNGSNSELFSDLAGKLFGLKGS
jgi:hypothetical protein